MDQNFIRFLREKRHLDEDLISVLVNEKIDPYAVNAMSDQQLMSYIPKMGDRIAIRQYCRTEVTALDKSSLAVSKATESLMNKIIQRLASKRDYSDHNTEKLSSTLNVKKSNKTYQIGLLEEDEGSFIQIREKKGGGIRQLKASRDATVDELLQTGIDLFFPQGQNKLGNVSDFQFTLRDFTETELDSSMTLGRIYDLRKVKLLRLYVSCKRTYINVLDSQSTSSLPTQPITTNIVFHEPFTEANILTSTPTATYATSKLTTDTVTASSSTTTYLCLESDDELSSSVHFDGFVLSEEDKIQEQSTSISLDEEIQVGYIYLPDDNIVLDDTLPMFTASVQPSSVDQKNTVIRLRLRRGNIFNELNAAFKDEKLHVDDMLLEIEMVLPNGTVEKGEDNGGVLRDALSKYWETFFLKCTTGNALKVPMIRHDMKDEWENEAKVMVLGYNMAHYFPVTLVKPFISHCLHHEIKDDELLATFLEILPDEEKVIAEQAMRDFQSISGKEEWLDFLDAHDIKRHVTQDNLRKTLLEVAHKEMVQDPSYVAECWSSILKGLNLPPGGLDEVMVSLTPTSRKVIAMLKHETLNKREDSGFP